MHSGNAVQQHGYNAHAEECHHGQTDCLGSLHVTFYLLCYRTERIQSSVMAANCAPNRTSHNEHDRE